MDGSKYRALGLLGVVFVAGAGVGFTAERLDLLFADGREPEERTESDDRRRGSGERGNLTTIERFADDLGLTTEQRSEVESILDHYREDLRTLRASVRPQYSALLDSVRVRIESVLTDEQTDDYRGLLEQRYGGRRGDEDEGDRDRDD